jgi:hypothetical protein
VTPYSALNRTGSNLVFCMSTFLKLCLFYSYLVYEIYNAQHSGGYTQKQIGDHFSLYYSQISRIVAKYKT